MFDVQGVLLAGEDVLPGTVEAQNEIISRGDDFRIVTNDASKDIPTLLKHFKSHGFPVTEERIVSSGILVKDYFEQKKLYGAKTMVLGPEESFGYLADTGVEIVDFNHNSLPEVVVILNQSFTQGAEESFSILLTAIINQINLGVIPKLILPNCDLNYPSGNGVLKFAPGTMALALEASIKNYLNDDNLVFERLGKPYSPIYEKGFEGYDRKDVIFYGDQFNTDIKGANEVGIDSVLVTTGLNNEGQVDFQGGDRKPKFVIDTF